LSAPPFFPALPGLGWSVHKKPTFSTVVAKHVSGREVRDPLYQYPLWQFELKFDALGSDTINYPGAGALSLQTLMGFFLQCQGQFGTFLYVDPTDNSVVNQNFAVGDGATTTFAMARGLGGFLETVGWVTNVSQVSVGGATLSAGWSLTAPNTLSFSTAPAVGALIGASFAYAFECRFDDDSADFEQFMHNLWRVDSLTFRSVRTS
jgi:hypothetical protein